ncbi:Kiwa anti-phage protein KwaB-like domain-containing protein [Xanthomonas perforans]|uniref:Kiwa anti-phage protein KwaB-like domain-containing protein n=1 Tax=Xanthomonas TaxID=338 RepID=UPI001E629B41|nr:Kiwa anti-phage protein KwaB-like domain-containing protein [Xanthomonas vesicatoria]MCC8628531.1 DUF4868 domain-containing protein [Xanthomonas vesicatoria]MDG4483027.1 DUF4868 domain-containing protein [Xanthomonas vesicatoria]
MLNLFALTSNANARILRLPLTAQLQQSVTEIFTTQFASFNEGVTERVQFDGRYRPEEDELLFIDGYVDEDKLLDAVLNPMAITAYDEKVHSLDSIKALFTGSPDAVPRVLVQIFERRRLIAKGLALFFTGNTFQKVEAGGLTLDSKLLAVLEGNTLIFQSFHYLRRVFAVADHYKEATAAEVVEFASHPSLHSADPQNFERSANSIIRSKIGLILQSGVLNNHTPQQLAAAALIFNVQIPLTTDGKIELPDSPADLRRLLRFLDEDYYESPLSQTHFISNSKRVAD